MYVADTLAAITIRLFHWSGADKFEMPLFSEMMEKKPIKNESAMEIKQRILDRLANGKGGKQDDTCGTDDQNQLRHV